MAHWEHRDEAKWKSFRFNQPYAKGLTRLRNDVLAKTDFATLWQWALLFTLCVACDDGGGTSSYCPNYLEFTSPCGVTSTTTTCGTTPVGCTNDVGGTICTVGPVSGNCMVSVVLGDGTTHGFDVTYGPSPDPICKVDVVTSDAPDFTSPTCGAGDAGSD